MSGGGCVCVGGGGGREVGSGVILHRIPHQEMRGTGIIFKQIYPPPPKQKDRQLRMVKLH